MAESVRPEIAKLQKNIELIIKGKSGVVKNALICTLARGHLLIEDVPGVGKTTLAQLLARSLDLSFSRIQLTSDMLPSDILGVSIYDPQTHKFGFNEGPIFANVVLADELNRTSPKTQSALLEAMSTSQVSMDRITHQLPLPFTVLATQNPIEFHGTFPLPKSQMDRFMMRLHLGYPSIEDEVRVLREQRVVGDIEQVQPVMAKDELLAHQAAVDRVKIEDSLLQYMAELVHATRTTAQVLLGASTRGALALRRAAQAKAYYENRDFCTPDDVKELVIPVLAHRIQTQHTFETTGFHHAEEQNALSRILQSVPVPA